MNTESNQQGRGHGILLMIIGGASTDEVTSMIHEWTESHPENRIDVLKILPRDDGHTSVYIYENGDSVDEIQYHVIRWAVATPHRSVRFIEIPNLDEYDEIEPYDDDDEEDQES